MHSQITDDQWMRYTRDGYLRVGKILTDPQLAELQQRIDDIMLGKAAVDYGRMLMQLDSESGEYKDAGPKTKGHKGTTLNYRKIEQLEYDSLFLRYVQHPIFREICVRTYGDQVPIAVFRAMFMNKPAGKGTKLPWHQDRWSALDRDPLITIYTALDPATSANGCVQIIPRSHTFGVINLDHRSGYLTEQQMVEHCHEEQAIDLTLDPAEAVLLHNWLLHRSDENHSGQSRRAFSVCYMDARTVDKTAENRPIVFGAGALDPGVLGGNEEKFRVAHS